MKKYYINVAFGDFDILNTQGCFSSNGEQYDCDISLFKNWQNKWSDAREYHLNLQVDTYKMGICHDGIDTNYFDPDSKEFKRALKSYADFWSQYISPETCVFKFVDEPSTHEEQNLVIKHSDAIHNSNTKFKTLVNPTINIAGSNVNNIDIDMLECSDILCPNKENFSKNESFRKLFLNQMNSTNTSCGLFEFDGTNYGINGSYNLIEKYDPSHIQLKRGIYLEGDFNGDNKADLIALYKYQSGATKVLEWKGTQAGISNKISIKGEYSSENLALELGKYFTGDFNGDGKDDLLCIYRYPDGSTSIFEWEGTSEGLSPI